MSKPKDISTLKPLLVFNVSLELIHLIGSVFKREKPKPLTCGLSSLHLYAVLLPTIQALL